MKDRIRRSPAIGEVLDAAREQDGAVLDYSRLAKRLDVSVSAALEGIAELERGNLVVLLRPYPGGENRRRGSKIHLRSPRSVLGSSALAEALERELTAHPGSGLYHSMAYSGAGIDLIVDRAGFRFAVKTVPSPTVRRRSLLSLQGAWKGGVIHRGFALHPDQGAFFLFRGVVAVPAGHFLGAYEAWTAAGSTNSELRLLLRWSNGSVAVGSAASAGLREILIRGNC